MKKKSLLTYVFVLLHVILIFSAEGTEESGEYEFVPTDEWQEIPDGVAVPGGLEYKMDLSQGKKWARNLQQPQNTKEQAIELAGTQSSDEDSRVAVKYVDEKDIEREGGKKNSDLPNWDDFVEALGVTDEVKLLKKNLHFILSPSSSVETKETALDQLVDLCHKYDNALIFVDEKGLEAVADLLGSSHEGVVSRTANLLGVVVQNNPRAQIAAIEIGLFQKLLQLCHTSIKSGASTSASHSFFALSAFIRSSGEVQDAFLQLNGMELLEAVLDSNFSDVGVRLKRKAITLIEDLMSQLHYNHSSVAIVNQILQPRWCNRIARMLNSSNEELIEHSLKSLILMQEACRSQISEAGTQKTILELKEKYKKNAEGGDDEYSKDLLELIRRLSDPQ